MGTDKSRLILGGKTAVERIADALKNVAAKTAVIGRTHGDELLPHISDLRENWGPLGGIEAALRASTTKWSIIVACDLPFVTGELFKRLLTFAVNTGAVVPVQSDGHPQPLCAILCRDACLRAAEESIARDEHSPRALLDKVRTRYVNFDQLADLPGSENFFFNVNTPENYARAQEILGS